MTMRSSWRRARDRRDEAPRVNIDSSRRASAFFIPQISRRRRVVVSRLCVWRETRCPVAPARPVPGGPRARARSLHAELLLPGLRLGASRDRLLARTALALVRARAHDPARAPPPVASSWWATRAFSHSPGRFGHRSAPQIRSVGRGAMHAATGAGALAPTLGANDGRGALGRAARASPRVARPPRSSPRRDPTARNASSRSPRRVAPSPLGATRTTATRAPPSPRSRDPPSRSRR